MKKTRTLMIVLLGAGVCALGLYLFSRNSPEAEEPSEDRFPIVSKFEFPRNYGYFIGDEIPLDLVIETTGGVVLDLVNLPRKGDKHGLFEIRDFSLSTDASGDEYKVYRISYVLQYFGATPLTAQFEGLEILYALADERRRPNGSFSYKSLFTQPTPINMSRIGPFRPTQAIGLKGPMEVQNSWLIWISYITGAGILLIVLSHWLWERRRHARLQLESGQDVTTITETILQALRQEGAAYRPIDEPSVSAVDRLSHLVRQFLHGEYSIPAFTSTISELALYVSQHPFAEELLHLLNRCEAVKYQPLEMSRMEERQLWWEAIALFEKKQMDGRS